MPMRSILLLSLLLLGACGAAPIEVRSTYTRHDDYRRPAREYYYNEGPSFYHQGYNKRQSRTVVPHASGRYYFDGKNQRRDMGSHRGRNR
jgi:hypothetical protein